MDKDKLNSIIAGLVWELEYMAIKAGDEEISKKAFELKILLFERKHGKILKGSKI